MEASLQGTTGSCSVCGDECNWMSQTCGRCPRNGTMIRKHLKHLQTETAASVKKAKVNPDPSESGKASEASEAGKAD